MKAVLYISIIAIVFRLYLLAEFFPSCCTSDENTYFSIATNLVNGEGFVLKQTDDRRLWTDRVYGAKPPLYPLFISGIFTIFGDSYNAVKIIQSILAAITGYFIYKTSAKIFSNKVGIFSLIIFSFFWESAIMSSMLLAENLYWLCLSIFVYLIISAKNYYSFAAAGIVLGLMTLTRAPSLSFLIPISIWLLWKDFSLQKVFRLSVLTLFCILTMLPWIQRNYHIYHQFVPVYTDGAINFWMGNYKDSGGSYNVADPDDPTQTPVLLTKDSRQETERDNFYIKQAIVYINESPFAAIDTNIRKIFMTFSVHRPEILNTTGGYTNWFLSRPHSTGFNAFLEFLVSYEFCIFIILFFTGTILLFITKKAIKRNGFLLIILTIWNLLIISATHYEPRYVTHMYPLMIPVVGFVLLPIYRTLKGMMK